VCVCVCVCVCKSTFFYVAYKSIQTHSLIKHCLVYSYVVDIGQRAHACISANTMHIGLHKKRVSWLPEC